VGGTVNYGAWGIQGVQNKNKLFFSTYVGPTAEGAAYMLTASALLAGTPVRITDIPLSLTTATDNFFIGQYGYFGYNDVYVHDGTNMVVWSNPADVNVFLATCFNVDDWLFCTGRTTAEGYELRWVDLNNSTDYVWTMAETCPGTCSGDPRMETMAVGLGRVWWVGHQTTDADPQLDQFLFSLPVNPAVTDVARAEVTPQLGPYYRFVLSSYAVFVMYGTSLTSFSVGVYNPSTLVYTPGTGLNAVTLGGGVVNDVYIFRNVQPGYNASDGFTLVSTRGDFSAPPTVEAHLYTANAQPDFFTDYATFVMTPSSIFLNMGSASTSLFTLSLVSVLLATLANIVVV